MPSTNVGTAAGFEGSSLPETTRLASMAHTVTFGSVFPSLASRLSREYQPPPIIDPEPRDLCRRDAVFGLTHEYRLVA